MRQSNYPNPTSGIVKVEAEGVCRIEVQNVSGQLVMTAAQSPSIDLASLPSGVCTMKVKTAKSAFVCRVAKR